MHTRECDINHSIQSMSLRNFVLLFHLFGSFSPSWAQKREGASANKLVDAFPWRAQHHTEARSQYVDAACKVSRGGKPKKIRQKDITHRTQVEGKATE